MSNLCTYCSSTQKIQDDHIRAQSKGGVTTTEACATCNQSKLYVFDTTSCKLAVEGVTGKFFK